MHRSEISPCAERLRAKCQCGQVLVYSIVRTSGLVKKPTGKVRDSAKRTSRKKDHDCKEHIGSLRASSSLYDHAYAGLKPVVRSIKKSKYTYMSPSPRCSSVALQSSRKKAPHICKASVAHASRSAFSESHAHGLVFSKTCIDASPSEK